MASNIDRYDIIIPFVFVLVVVFGLFNLFKYLDASEVEQSDYKEIATLMHKAKQEGDIDIINAIINATDDKIVTMNELREIHNVVYKKFEAEKSEKAKLLGQVEKIKAEQEGK
jgi:hypothetical protein